MTKKMDRESIEAAREEALDALAFSKQRLKQLLGAHALGNASEQDVIEAEASVRSCERKLEGFGFALEQVSAEEQARNKAKREARSREDAVRLLSLIEQRDMAVVDLDAAQLAGSLVLERIETLEAEIKLLSKGWFADDHRGEQGWRNFLLNLDALDMASIAYRIHAANGRLGFYYRGLMTGRPSALRSLNEALPNTTDEQVKKEAIAAARREAEKFNKQKGENDGND